MATLGSKYLNLKDLTKRKNPDGSIAKIVEMMDEVNAPLQDIPWVEGNLDTGHEFTSRTALPSPTWVKLNQGVDATKSQTDQYVESCGMLAARAIVDKRIVDRGGPAVRLSEEKPFFEGMAQEFIRAFFYESLATNPDRIHGLAARYNSTTGTAGAQIVNADASAGGTDSTSIWLINWRQDSVFGIHPKGTEAGLKPTDMGLQLVDDADSKQFKAWVTDYDWNVGVCVQDYRQVARVANIDTSRWKADLSQGADLVLCMEDAISAIQNIDSGTPMFYMNRACMGMLQKQLIKREASFLSWTTTERGRRVRAYNGIPITVTDAITSAESVVS